MQEKTFEMLLGKQDDELFELCRQATEAFLPNEDLYASNLKERLIFYVRDNLQGDLKRWGSKGKRILNQLSESDNTTDLQLAVIISEFILIRLTGYTDLPAVEITALSLLTLGMTTKL